MVLKQLIVIKASMPKKLSNSEMPAMRMYIKFVIIRAGTPTLLMYWLKQNL